MGISLTLPSTVIIGQSVLLKWTRDSDSGSPVDFDLVLFNDTCIGCSNCSPCDGIGDLLVHSNHALSGQVTYQVPGNITAGKYHVEPLDADSLFGGSDGASNSFQAIFGATTTSSSSRISTTSSTSSSTSASSSSSSTSSTTFTSTSTSPSSLSSSTSSTSAAISNTSSTSSTTTDSFATNAAQTTSPSVTPTSASSSKPNTAAIAGGVTAGVIIIALIALILYYRRRHAKRWSDEHFHFPDQNLSLQPWLGAPNQTQEISQVDLVARPFYGEQSSSDHYTASSGTPGSPQMPTKRQLQLKAQEEEVAARMAASARQASTRRTTSISSSSRSANDASQPNSEVAAENTRLRAEIQWLREQYESPWALGLTDELPPSYPGHEIRMSVVSGRVHPS